jgi:hypothetical protein
VNSVGHDLNSWHLDKKVPIGIISALFGQTVVVLITIVTWMNVTDARLTAVELRQEQNKGNRDRILVLEQQGLFIANTLARIEKKVDGITK